MDREREADEGNWRLPSPCIAIQQTGSCRLWKKNGRRRRRCRGVIIRLMRPRSRTRLSLLPLTVVGLLYKHTFLDLVADSLASSYNGSRWDPHFDQLENGKDNGRFLALTELAAGYQFELIFGPLHALNAAMVTRGRIRRPWPDLSDDLDPDTGGN